MNLKEFSKERILLSFFIFLLVSICSFFILFSFFSAKAKIWQDFLEEESLLWNDFNFLPSQIKEADLDSVSAKSFILVFVNKKGKEKVLLKRNEKEKRYIGSLTKLISAQVILKNLNLEKYFKINLKEIGWQGESKEDYILGKDLLKAGLLESNNAIFEFFAQKIGKEKTIREMNEISNDILLSENSHFASVDGIDNPENYSTAEDIYKVGKNLFLKNSEILDFLRERSFEVKNKEGKFIHLARNTNLALSLWPDAIISGKTGTTPKAKECLFLVLKAPCNSGYLFLVLLNSDHRYFDAKLLLKEAFRIFDWDCQKNFFTLERDNFWHRETKIPWEERDSLAVVMFKNKLFLYGGLDGNDFVVKPPLVKYWLAPHFSDIWQSEDGIHWKKVTSSVPWGKRRSMAMIPFKGKLFLYGGWGPEIGYKNDIWQSEDGIHWKKIKEHALWPEREGHIVLNFQDKLYLIGGVNYEKRKLFSDVWFSEDGINWKKLTDSVPWTPRWDHDVCVFKGKMFLVGGMNFEKNFSDIWVSEDGKDWQKIVSVPEIPDLQGHKVFVFDGKLVIFGRLAQENYMWYSQDGEHFRGMILPWLGREDFEALFYNGKLFIFGGMSADFRWHNDIWFIKVEDLKKIIK